MGSLRKLGLALAVAASFGYSAAAVAGGDPSTRDWLPAPPGTGILAAYGVGLDSHGMYEDGKRVDGSVKLRGLVLRPMYFSTLFGKTVQYEAIIPAFRTSAPGSGLDTLSGVGDIQLGAAMWFVEDDVNKLWVAYEPFITLPTGRYQSGNADTSPGDNRWTTTHDFAIVKGIGESTFLEASAEVEFFGNNSNYYGDTLKQEPALRLFAMASTNITESTYIGARYRYETGGKVKIGSYKSKNASDHQLAFEITTDLTEQDQVQLQYIHDLKVVNGPRMRGVQLRYAHVF